MVVGYVNYTIFLMLLTGGVILRLDVKTYELKKIKKERRVARFLGWLNVVLGVLIFIGDWVYQTYL